MKNDDLKNVNDASRRCDGVRSDDARLNDDCLMSDDAHLNDDDCPMNDGVRLMSCAPNDEFHFRFSE